MIDGKVTFGAKRRHGSVERLFFQSFKGGTVRCNGSVDRPFFSQAQILFLLVAPSSKHDPAYYVRR